MTEKKMPPCGWPFYKITPSNNDNNELVVIAECVPLFYSNFSNEFCNSKNSDIICPKLDDASECVINLTALINNNSIDTITILLVDKKCCGYLTDLVEEAIKKSNKQINMNKKVISQKRKI
ncbi:MAG: hypothetical protein ACOYVD_15535 [Bacillota bacterium]